MKNNKKKSLKKACDTVVLNWVDQTSENYTDKLVHNPKKKKKTLTK